MSDKIMTDLKELKQNVLMTAKKAYDEKLMAGTSGNISAYFREKQWGGMRGNTLYNAILAGIADFMGAALVIVLARP